MRIPYVFVCILFINQDFYVLVSDNPVHCAVISDCAGCLFFHAYGLRHCVFVYLTCSRMISDTVRQGSRNLKTTVRGSVSFSPCLHLSKPDIVF